MRTYLVLCEFENIISCQPLTYLSDNPNEFVQLTPVMYLREQAEGGMPDCDLLEKASFIEKFHHKQ